MEGKRGKKIIFFAGRLTAGGAERAISILSGQFAAQHYRVEIVLFRKKEVFYALHPHIKVLSIEERLGSKNLFKKLRCLRHYLKKQDGIVLSFMAPFNMLVLFATLFTSVPVLVSDRNDPRRIPKQRSMRWLRNLLYCSARGVVVQTAQNQRYFARFLRKGLYIIPNTIDLGEQTGLGLRTEKKKKIVSVGRLTRQKNYRLLLDAYADLLPDFPGYTLWIYGEGDERAALEGYIRERHLEGKVFLPGEQKDIFPCIADAVLFVMSSDHEGMSNALMEAMCLGLPVVSTDVSGAEDLIEDGKNGMVVKRGDRRALCSAMRKMLRDQAFRAHCAGKAVSVAESYSPERILRQWINLL